MSSQTNGRMRRGGRGRGPRRDGERPKPMDTSGENKVPNAQTVSEGKGDGKGKALPRPYVLEPREGGEAVCSLLLLHGFACSARSCAASWVPFFEKMGDLRDRCRLVFLNAPKRQISCYGRDKPTEAAWHDYFSDHGGAEGRPEIEEDIDLHDLAESRALVHAAVDAEAARYGGDYSRVALFGESQGGCTALDVATTHAKTLGGVFCSFGQLYSATPVAPRNKDLKVVVWHGSRDATIAPSLTLRSVSRLLDRGFKRLTLHVEDGLGHCENSQSEAACLGKALRNWGFTSRDRAPRRADRDRAASAETVVAEAVVVPKAPPPPKLHAERPEAATVVPKPKDHHPKRPASPRNAAASPPVPASPPPGLGAAPKRAPTPKTKSPPASPKKPPPKQAPRAANAPAPPPGLSAPKLRPPPPLPRAEAPAVAPTPKAATPKKTPAAPGGPPPGLGAPSAPNHQFPCNECGETEPDRFSKTQLSKGATRRCKGCVQSAMVSRQETFTNAPIPMDEDSDSELEGYA